MLSCAWLTSWALLIRTISVSYTHLDVYKRQVMNRFGSAPDGSKGKACKNMRVLYLLRSGEYMLSLIHIYCRTLRLSYILSMDLGDCSTEELRGSGRHLRRYQYTYACLLYTSRCV